MAWSWRKRKTLIPGVRLNFGKRGISATIGPRGASMTFGPNGTYLNTSIPGTGLYNRKKIGGRNSTQMTNDNSGCGRFFLILLSAILWILVAFWAIAGFAVNVYVGIAFVSVLVITHTLVAVFVNRRAATTNGTTSRMQNIEKDVQNADTINRGSEDISEEYFKLVTKASEDLFSDYEKVLKLHDIDTIVDKVGVKVVMNEIPITDSKDKVRLLFWIDVTRCYTGLGHLIDLSSKEGLGLFYFIALTKGCAPKRPYSNFTIVKAVYQDDAEKILKAIKACLDSTPSIPEVFLLSRLLSSSETTLYRKFLVDIYRFASIIAKADNTVTNEEAEWLSNIMKLQNNSSQDIIQEDDEPVSRSYNETIIRNLDPMFAEVARWVVAHQEGSTSRLQRQFEIGYNRAGTLSDQLEEAGIVGPNKGPKGRNVLIQDLKELEKLLSTLLNSNYSKSVVESQMHVTSVKPIRVNTQNPTKMLDKLIGLDSVKKEVETLSNFIKIQQTRAAKGLKTSAVSYHCVFTGNPGTGKTTVARILAKIYKNLGVVSKGHLVETDRAGLVAEYVGQTAVKTNKIIDTALDGVLFIDEAYSLIGGGESDYGKEAIATLLKRMEDNRDRLIVILAGYTKNMKDFIDSNPGLQSRFNRYIEFPDYSAEALLQIYEANMKKYEYHFGEGAKEHLQQYFENEVANKDANFGNGRLVRNVFEKTLERQANRLAREVNLTMDKLSQIEVDDFPVK